MSRHRFFNSQQLDIARMLATRFEAGFVRRATAGRPDAVTFVLDSGEFLLIRNRSVELQKFDVGALDFESVRSAPVGSSEFELPPVLRETRSVDRVLTSYCGDEFEVGVMLRIPDALPFVVVPGGVPSTLAILGSSNRDHEWSPEYEIREYWVERWC